MIDVAIRFDDPSVTSDHALERAILEVMKQHAVRATFAVIPYIQKQAIQAERVPHLVAAHQAQLIEVAQHGFNHENHHGPAAIPSEFSGLPHAAQIEKIIAGRIALGKVFAHPMMGFVPPFNTFDAGTVDILVTQGFRYLSAGSEHGHHKIDPLALLPRTCQITELKKAVTEARRRPDGKLAIIPVMHHYDFKESGQADAPLTLPSFSALLLWLTQQADVRINTLSELSEHHAIMVWRKATERARWLQRQHWRVRAHFPGLCLMTRPLYHYIRPVASLKHMTFPGDEAPQP